VSSGPLASVVVLRYLPLPAANSPANAAVVLGWLLSGRRSKKREVLNRPVRASPTRATALAVKLLQSWVTSKCLNNLRKATTTQGAVAAHTSDCKVHTRP